jgi:hypothetical protein
LLFLELAWIPAFAGMTIYGDLLKIDSLEGGNDGSVSFPFLNSLKWNHVWSFPKPPSKVIPP